MPTQGAFWSKAYITSSQYMADGNMPSKYSAVYRSRIDMRTQKRSKKTYPILENVLLCTPQQLNILHRQLQHMAPAQQIAEPAQHKAAKHIFIQYLLII